MSNKIYFDDERQRQIYLTEQEMIAHFQDEFRQIAEGITEAFSALKDALELAKSDMDEADARIGRVKRLNELISQQPDPDAARAAVEHECRGVSPDERESIYQAWINFWEDN